MSLHSTFCINVDESSSSSTTPSSSVQARVLAMSTSLLKPRLRTDRGQFTPKPGTFIPILPDMSSGDELDHAGNPLALSSRMEGLFGPALGGVAPMLVNPLQYQRILRRR